ncbi:sensor histidine kinase [Virgisporangium aurantiacum]|nr:ATP-binding protein [Virgisporangium aurantiacum]
MNWDRVTTLFAGKGRQIPHARLPEAGPEGGDPMPPNLAQSSLNSLTVGVLVLDGDDHPVLANPAAREMGLIRSSSDAHTIVRTLAGQTRRSGVTRVVELDIPRANSDAEPLGVHVRAIDIGGGYVAVEAADVTEAHRVARVRRDFVANVSHELKTPVGALQLLSEALQDALSGGEAGDSVPDEEAVARFADRIRHESARLSRLVSELLELSRLQGADPLPEPEPCSVDRIIAEVIDRSRTAANAKEIEIKALGERGLVAYGNEGQLVTAVANLVENAVAYSPEGTRVDVESGATDEAVWIAVRDEGIGIEASDLDRIFERFYRADRARSRQTGGTGLGLAIVKHIATNHGGRVDVTSTVGRGSTFTLRLPSRSSEQG